MIFLKTFYIINLFFFATQIYTADEWINSKGIGSIKTSTILDKEGNPWYIQKFIMKEFLTNEILSYEIANVFGLDCVAKVEKDEDNNKNCTIRSYYINFEAGNKKSQAISLFFIRKKILKAEKTDKDGTKALKNFIKKIDPENLIQLGIFYFLTEQRDTNYNNILIQHFTYTDKYFLKAIDFTESFYRVIPRINIDNPKDFLLELITTKKIENENINVSIKNNINSVTFAKLFNLIETYQFSPVKNYSKKEDLLDTLYKCLGMVHTQFSFLTNYQHLLQFQNQYNNIVDLLSDLIDNNKENESNLQKHMILFCNQVYDLKIKIEIFNRVLFLKNILHNKKLTNSILINSLFKTFPDKPFAITFLEEATKKNLINLIQ